jgi:hypothetical protein
LRYIRNDAFLKWLFLLLLADIVVAGMQSAAATCRRERPSIFCFAATAWATLDICQGRTQFFCGVEAQIGVF